MHGLIKVLVLLLYTVEGAKKEAEPIIFSKKYPTLGKNSTIPMSFAILRGVIEVKFLQRLVKNGRFLTFSKNVQ